MNLLSLSLALNPRIRKNGKIVFYLPAHRALPNAIHLYALAYKCKLTCPKIQRGGGGGGGGGRGGNTLADYKGVTL